jgi:hypothetical protein
MDSRTLFGEFYPKKGVHLCLSVVINSFSTLSFREISQLIQEAVK